MAAGALPAVDRQILLLEHWYRSEIKAVADPQHAQALRQFTTWRLLPRMRARAARQLLTSGTRNAAAHEFCKGRQYLAWLAERGRCLQESTQADVDAWYATATDPDATRTFLKWAIASQVFIRLGDPPTPVPEPFAAMLTELAANRVNMNTAANPGCQWLFPGQRVGQPLMPIGIRRRLHELGIPLTQARTAAFRQLVLQAPPPVVARSLGSTTARPPATP